MKKFVLLFILPILFFINVSKAEEFKLGVFDTSNFEGYKYKPFFDIAQSVDFKIDYKSIADVMDVQSISDLNINQYKGIIFIIGIEFVRNFVDWITSGQDSKKSIVTNRFLDLIEDFSKREGKMIGFAFPPGVKSDILFNLFKSMDLIKLEGQNSFSLKDFDVSNLDEKDVKTLEEDLRMLRLNLNNFLSLPLQARSFMYNTTLMPVKNVPMLGLGVNINQILVPLRNSKFALPIKKNGYSEQILTTFPYAMYWFNPKLKNHLFVISSPLLSFSGIAEDFRVCPMNFDLRKQMLDGIQEMLWELNIILSNNSNVQLALEKINKDNKPGEPECIESFGKNLLQSDDNSLRKIGWMELHHFDDRPEEKKEDRDFLIDCILKSGLDAVWIDLNPHMIYSSNSIHKIRGKKVQEEKSLWSRVKNFTSCLKSKADKLKITKLPKVLVGFEIANNFIAENMPKVKAFDLYSNFYESVSSLLSEGFWDQEIKRPLLDFIQEWNKPENSNGISIGGVILDLEMYARKSPDPGTFSATMGFSPQIMKTWDANFVLEFADDINENVKKLKDNDLQGANFQNYYNFIKSRSEEIGKSLRLHFDSFIPNGIIGCYSTSLSVDGFYEGFYKGLSNAQKPIELLTFNSEFNKFKSWLESRSIFVKHSCVLMLSKIKDNSNFELVSEILKRHNGIWFNKFQRLAEDRNPGVLLEWAPIPRPQRLEFCDYIKTVR